MSMQSSSVRILINFEDKAAFDQTSLYQEFPRSIGRTAWQMCQAPQRSLFMAGPRQDLHYYRNIRDWLNRGDLFLSSFSDHPFAVTGHRLTGFILDHSAAWSETKHSLARVLNVVEHHVIPRGCPYVQVPFLAWYDTRTP